jgi:hypothetical protein
METRTFPFQQYYKDSRFQEISGLEILQGDYLASVLLASASNNKRRVIGLERFRAIRKDAKIWQSTAEKSVLDESGVSKSLVQSSIIVHGPQSDETT